MDSITEYRLKFLEELVEVLLSVEFTDEEKQEIRDKASRIADLSSSVMDW